MGSTKRLCHLFNSTIFRKKTASVSLALVLLGHPAGSRGLSQARATVNGLNPGLVVESVLRHGEAEKAGLREGDLLLSWSRDDQKGEFDSPFDVMATETEQAPRGVVKLDGLRGTERQVWSLGPDDWGLTARPNFARDLLSSYREGQELAKTDKPAEIVKAAERWKELANRYSGSHGSWLPAWLFLHAAEVLRDAKEWTQADDAYQSAVQSAAGTGPVIEGQTLQVWATAYQQRSAWAEAEKRFQQSIAKSESSGGGQLATAANLNALGRIAYQRGDLGKAEQYHRQALEIQQNLAPKSVAAAASLNGLGNVAYDRGNLDKAEQYHRQALDIREKLIPGSLAVAASLNNLGNVARQRGDLSQAELYFREAFDIEEKLAPASLAAAAILTNLGSVAYEQGELAKAERYYRQAFDIREKLAPGSLAVAASLIGLGIVDDHRGNLAQAEEYYRKALDIETKLAPESLGAAAILSDLGNVAQQREDLAQAEEYHRKALEIKQKMAPGSMAVATSLNNLGNVERERGNLTMAERHLRQALDIKQRLAPASLDVAEGFNGLGIVAYEQGDFAKAEEYYRQAHAINEKLAPESLGMADTLQRLADLARKSHDLGNAGRYYRQALAIRERLAPGSMDNAESLAAVASILRDQQQLDSAAQFYVQALSALESQTSHLGGSEEVRSGFRARHSDIYKDSIDLLLAQKQPDRALEVLERSRARILLEMLVSARVDIRKGADPSLREQERSLQESLAAKSDRRLRLLGEKINERQIAAFTTEIEDLEKQYQEVEERLRLNSPGYAALTQPQPLTASEIQQLLDPDTLLLEYSLGEERSYVFAVTRDSLAVQELPKRADIQKLARRVYDLLTERNRVNSNQTRSQRQGDIVAKNHKEYTKAVAALSRIILAPVSAQLSGKRLLVVADGALQYIPFAILPTRAFSGARSPVPLMVEHEIVNVPSASILWVLRQQAIARTPAPKAVGVLADPVFSQTDPRLTADTGMRAPGGRAARLRREAQDRRTIPMLSSSPGDRLTRSATELGVLTSGLELPRLRFSRREARAIMALTPVGEGMAALDFEASRSTALSPQLAQYRVIHFATHGLINNLHPELSGLVLSLVNERGKPQNGFLELQDVYDLNLPVELVVLSSCESGLGKEIQGEGLMGLTRGFMYAGASRVVASLWNVSDVATAELMKRFYSAMEKDGMRPAAALRQAQIGMWKQRDWNSPYYWAAFQLQGEWK